MAAQEDRARFTAFVADNRSTLARTAYLLTGDATLAEDLLQESLIRAFPRWGQVQSGSELAYLRRIMANLRTDWWRRRRWEGGGGVPDAVAATPVWGRPDGGMAAVEDRDLIVRRLAPLTARERTVVVLRYYADLTETAVAAELGITVGTVKSTCARALARLAKEPVS